jgi:hypothetical protein
MVDVANVKLLANQLAKHLVALLINNVKAKLGIKIYLVVIKEWSFGLIGLTTFLL